MKKINPWLVLLFNIITLGVYSLFWLINRRREIIQTYNQSIPPVGWIITAFISTFVTTLIIYVGPLIWNEIIVAVASLAGLLFLIAGLTIAIWWIWSFAKASRYVTEGRMPAGWTLTLYILSGPVATLFLQYYFNRAPKKIADKPPKRPSIPFIILAILVILVSTTISVAMASSDIQELITEEQQLTEQKEKLDNLTRDHQTCVSKLTNEYREVTIENEAAYNKAYDDCEDVRVKQNKAVEEYDRLLLE